MYRPHGSYGETAADLERIPIIFLARANILCWIYYKALLFWRRLLRTKKLRRRSLDLLTIVRNAPKDSQHSSISCFFLICELRKHEIQFSQSEKLSLESIKILRSPHRDGRLTQTKCSVFSTTANLNFELWFIIGTFFQNPQSTLTTQYSAKILRSDINRL